MADGIVYLTADFTAAVGTQTTATIERSVSGTGGPWTLLGTVDLLSQVGSFTDTLAPFDTPLYYRWTGSPGAAVITQGPITEASTGSVVLRDPLRPWANLNLQLCASMSQAVTEACGPLAPDLVWVGLGDKTYRADANLFDVYDARVPADVYGVRKRLDGSMKILSKTLVGKDAVETFFAAGGPIAIHLPAIYGFPDAVVQPGDVVETYVSGARDQRIPLRIWEIPFTVVDQPLGPVQGTECANWCAVETAYPTFAALTATGYTWSQVASGIAVCPSGEIDGFGIGPFGDGPFGDGG